MEFLFPSIILVVVGLIVVSNILHRRKFDKLSAVNPAVEYPNNHHVMGVGYYHAASQKWFPHLIRLEKTRKTKPKPFTHNYWQRQRPASPSSQVQVQYIGNANGSRHG